MPLDAALERAAAVGALATTSPGDKDGLPTRGRLDAFIASTARGPALSESCTQAC